MVIEGDWEYERQGDNTLKLRRYNGRDDELVMPPEVRGYPVTAIACCPLSNSGHLQVFASEHLAILILGDILLISARNLCNMAQKTDHNVKTYVIF